MTNTTPFAEIADRVNRDPSRRKRIEVYKRAIDDALALATLRDESSVAPGAPDEVTDLHSMDNPPVDRADVHYLDALRDYLADLGGQLIVEAVFPGLRVNLLRADGTPPSQGPIHQGRIRPTLRPHLKILPNQDRSERPDQVVQRLAVELRALVS